MSIFNRILGILGVNPASGLPMLNHSIDVAGNPLGTNLAESSHDPFHDDTFTSTFDNDSFNRSDDSFHSTFDNNSSFSSDNF
ncbi:MAG: hypothetical protein EOP04_04295 [Proteobacteria bacterium]|nr:MAG: hypothetical protein EOP04_04295 [Pseudomonadota bacterium]